MDKVVAVPVVQVVLACAACSSTRLTCPSLSSCSTLTRWSISLLAGRAVLQGARCEKTVLSHSCRSLRKPSRSHSCSTRRWSMSLCLCRSCVVPWCRSWWPPTAGSLRNSSRSRSPTSASRQPCSALFLDKVFTELQAVAACGE